jgi:iron complex transport system ATP-binding protein
VNGGLKGAGAGTGAIIRAQNIGFAYADGQAALTDVSFTIAKAENIALAGPNGSGKSTLLRLLAGLAVPSSGRALLRGREAASVPPRERAKLLAFVPQQADGGFPFTCLEIVLMALYPHRKRLAGFSDADIALARQVMAETGVWRFADRSVTGLSGGERQRVIMSRALLQVTADGAGADVNADGVHTSVPSRVLLLDEAMSALDIAARIDMMKLLSRLAAERGIAVVGVLHDLETACRFADRVIALADGRLAADGSPDEVFSADFLRRVFSVKADILPDGGFTVKDSITNYQLAISN